MPPGGESRAETFRTRELGSRGSNHRPLQSLDLGEDAAKRGALQKHCGVGRGQNDCAGSEPEKPHKPPWGWDTAGLGRSWKKSEWGDDDSVM